MTSDSLRFVESHQQLELTRVYDSDELYFGTKTFPLLPKKRNK